MNRRFQLILFTSAVMSGLSGPCRAAEEVRGGPVVDSLQLHLTVARAGESRSLVLSVVNRSSRTVFNLVRDHLYGPADNLYPPFLGILVRVKPPVYNPGVQTAVIGSQRGVDRYGLKPGDAYRWSMDITSRVLNTDTQYLRFAPEVEYAVAITGFVRVEGKGTIQLVSNSVALKFDAYVESAAGNDANLVSINLSAEAAVLNVGSATGVQVNDVYSTSVRGGCESWIFTIVGVGEHFSTARIYKIGLHQDDTPLLPCEDVPHPHPGMRVFYCGRKSKGPAALPGAQVQ